MHHTSKKKTSLMEKGERVEERLLGFSKKGKIDLDKLFLTLKF